MRDVTEGIVLAMLTGVNGCESDGDGEGDGGVTELYCGKREAKIAEDCLTAR